MISTVDAFSDWPPRRLSSARPPSREAPAGRARVSTRRHQAVQQDAHAVRLRIRQPLSTGRPEAWARPSIALRLRPRHGELVAAPHEFVAVEVEPQRGRAT